MSPHPGDPDVIHRSTAELVTLLCASRRGSPDWREHYVESVIQQAMREHPPMTWEQIAVGMVRLMVDPKAIPRELLPDSRTPLAHKTVLPRDRNEGWAAAAREDLLATIQSRRDADQAAEAAARAQRAAQDRERGVA